MFARYDEHALCLLMMIAYRVLRERPNYMECLRSLELDCDGDVEECVSIAKGWKQTYRKRTAHIKCSTFFCLNDILQNGIYKKIFYAIIIIWCIIYVYFTQIIIFKRR